MKDNIGRYLSRHAEPEAHARPRLSKRYRAVIVVPAFDERASFLARVLKEQRDDVLTVLVVNVPDTLPRDDPAFARTHRLLTAEHGSNVIVVDRVSRPIPRRRGVGLARKIGSDIAVAYIADGTVLEPVIYSTDADVTLPAGYLDAIGDARDPKEGAWLFPYRHVADDEELLRRINLYELHMRLYVAGLREAGSPYAFHALGSTIAVSAKAYAEVRGYPRRDAAEDFYLLNKLAKVTRIRLLKDPVVTVAARMSHRVPFGTGPALANIPDRDEDYLSYDPRSFACLGRVIRAISANCEDRLAAPARPILQALGYFEHLARNPSLEQRHQWLDGLRTLRFIHLARDQFPDAPLVRSATLLRGKESSGNGATAQALLEGLRTEDRKGGIRGVPAMSFGPKLPPRHG